MLQGSLDNFGLNEVLGLLADTSKTGRMRITGDRGSGSLWLVSGKLVGSEASRTDDGSPMEETMFELLRFSTGNFSFNSEETTAAPVDEQPVDNVLGAAFERLHQWREIEAVVPSLAHIVAPVAVLPAPEVTVTAEEWELLMAIGAGAEVGSICEHFGLGEVEGSRRVKLLIERSLIEISAPSSSPGVVAAAAPASAAESDDFGLAPAGLTTDDGIHAAAASPGAFDAVPATGEQSSSELAGTVPTSDDPAPSGPAAGDPASSGDAAWAMADPVAEAAPAPAWTPAPEYEAPAADAEASVFEAPVAEAPSASASMFEADPAAEVAPPAETSAAPDATVFDAPVAPAPVFDAPAPVSEHDAFAFPPDPPAPHSGPMRRASDAMPPPPPAPPGSFDQFDAPTPPPPAPPSPADLVGSERVDGAEARRLLAGRSTFAEDGTETIMDHEDALAADEDDGSPLMQYLSDES